MSCASKFGLPDSHAGNERDGGRVHKSRTSIGEIANTALESRSQNKKKLSVCTSVLE